MNHPASVDMSGAGHRRKGNRVAREVVAYLKARGLAAERMPLSGAAGGSFIGDLTLPLLGQDLCGEVKIRRDGFRQIYDWLADRDVLFIRSDRREPLVVVRPKLAADVALAAERGKGSSRRKSYEDA